MTKYMFDTEAESLGHKFEEFLQELPDHVVVWHLQKYFDRVSVNQAEVNQTVVFDLNSFDAEKSASKEEEHMSRLVTRTIRNRLDSLGGSICEKSIESISSDNWLVIIRMTCHLLNKNYSLEQSLTTAVHSAHLHMDSDMSILYLLKTGMSILRSGEWNKLEFFTVGSRK